MTVGPVFCDPRGKVNRAGEQEHVFTIRKGASLQHARFENQEKAEEARRALLGKE